jgi:hypothetical protein
MRRTDSETAISPPALTTTAYWRNRLAYTHLTTISDQWNVAVTNHEAAQSAASALQDHPAGRVRHEVLCLANDACRDLFRTASPTLGAIRTKLEALWGGSLYEETAFATVRRMVIGDLVRIELLLLGVDPSEASGGMDLAKLESDWINAVQSDAASSSRGEKAAPTILDLSAPSLTAVATKLQAIWEHVHDADDIDCSVAQLMILRDLYRFILKHEASSTPPNWREERQ